MVERDLAKVEVAGSSPVSRSILRRHSQVVRQRSAKPLSPVQIRVSPPSFYTAGVVEQVDTRDLKSLEFSSSCRFKSGLWYQAGIAQLVERNLAKVEVAGSSPVSRSIF